MRSHCPRCGAQSIGTRVANLPLVSSACGIVSSAYNSTKGSHPYVRSVCDAAEKGVRTLTAAAVSGAQPILTKLEPQSEWGSPQMWGWGALWGHTSEFFFSGGFLVSTANEYACKGLDKLEEKLPILQQPTEKVTWGAWRVGICPSAAYQGFIIPTSSSRTPSSW